MATDPTPEQCAMRILREYIKADKRVGEGYTYENIVNFHREWKQDDIRKGIDFCLEKKWFEKNPNGVLLFTVEGYREAPERESV